MIMPKKHSSKLLFTDTGSLAYEIEIGNVYEDFYEDKGLLDLSNYPKDSKFFDPDNVKTIGKMKDEFKGEIIRGFVRLKSNIPPNIRFDEDVLAICLQDVFKTFSRRLQNALEKPPHGIFKTSSRLFEEAFKTSSRDLQDILRRRF